MDVLVAQASILLGQLPSKVRKESKRDIDLVFLVNESMSEKTKQEMEKNSSGHGGGTSVMKRRR